MRLEARPGNLGRGRKNRLWEQGHFTDRRCGEASLERDTVVANILCGRKSLTSPQCGRMVSEGSRFGTPGSQNWALSHPV